MRWSQRTLAVAVVPTMLATACFSSGPIGAFDGAAPVIDAGPPDADPADATPLVEGVVTLVGSNTSGDTDGARNVARFDNPVNLAVGPNRDLFVCDFYNGTIRRVTEAGTVTTITRDKRFARPFGIVFSPSGQLYVQTDRNTLTDLGGALWQINPVSGVATLLLDNVGRRRGLAVLGDGRLVLVDDTSNEVSTWDLAERVLVPLAGTAGTSGHVDATGTAARFRTPYDVVIDGDGDLIIADLGNHVLRRVTLAGEVTTFAGNGVAATVDGTLLAASFNGPKALAIDGAGRIFVTETGGYVIRMISAGQVTTIAGDGVGGFRDGAPMQAEFFGLEGLDVDDQYLYVADGDGGLPGDLPYHRVRRVSLP